MGISIGEAYSRLRPLLGLTEQVTVVPAGREITVHSPAFKILYFFAGEVTLSLDNGSRYAIRPGDVAAVLSESKNKPYSYTWKESTGKNLHALILQFDLTPPPPDPQAGEQRQDELTLWLRNTFRTHQHWSTLPGPKSITDSHTLWETAIRIRAAFESRNQWMRLLACELARLMTLRLAAAAGLEAPLPRSPRLQRLEALCQWMFTRNTLPEDDRDDALFKRHFELTPLQFLQRLRVDRAKSLLLNSNTLIGQIGSQVGFSSPGTFSRVFQSIAGLSPSQYRRGHSANRLFSIKNESPQKLKMPSPGEHPGPWQWQIRSRTTTLAKDAPHLVLALEGNATVELPNRQTHCLCAEENSLLLTTRQIRIHGEHFRVALLPLTGFRGRVSLAKTMRPTGWKWLDHGLTEAIIPLREALGHKAENRYERLLLHSLTSTLVYQSLGLAEEPLPPSRITRDRPRYDLLTESAKEYISKHYSHPLTLGEIAYAVGVSEEHLARLFQTTTGTSVMAFLFEYRARQANSLLLQNRLSISEIAYRCGFQTVGHFYRTFRAVFDQTPGGVRSGEK